MDILVENEIESAYIVYIEDLHGTEYSGASKPALEEVGIEVHGMKAIPPDIQDMTSIINDAIDPSRCFPAVCLSRPELPGNESGNGHGI